MTKQEYCLKSKGLAIKVSQLFDDQNKVKQEYIISNKEFEIDQKVLVVDRHTRKRSAFIKSIYINFQNDIKYKFNDIKKDGNKSKLELHLLGYKSINTF